MEIKTQSQIGKAEIQNKLERLLLDEEGLPCVAYLELIRERAFSLVDIVAIYRVHIPCIKDSDGLGVLFYAFGYRGMIIEVSKHLGRLIKKAEKKLIERYFDVSPEEFKLKKSDIPTRYPITFCGFITRERDVYTILVRKVFPFSIRFKRGKKGLLVSLVSSQAQLT